MVVSNSPRDDASESEHEENKIEEEFFTIRELDEYLVEKHTHIGVFHYERVLDLYGVMPTIHAMPCFSKHPWLDTYAYSGSLFAKFPTIMAWEENAGIMVGEQKHGATWEHDRWLNNVAYAHPFIGFTSPGANIKRLYTTEGHHKSIYNVETNELVDFWYTCEHKRAKLINVQNNPYLIINGRTAYKYDDGDWVEIDGLSESESIPSIRTILSGTHEDEIWIVTNPDTHNLSTDVYAFNQQSGATRLVSHISCHNISDIVRIGEHVVYETRDINPRLFIDNVPTRDCAHFMKCWETNRYNRANGHIALFSDDEIYIYRC